MDRKQVTLILITFAVLVVVIESAREFIKNKNK